MNGTQTRPQQPTDWDARCKLAASVLNQREPSWLTVSVAHMALNGCGIDEIRAFQDRITIAESGAA